MLAKFKNTTVTIRRLKATSGTKRAYFATATADGNIQEVDQINPEQSDGLYTDYYDAFFDSTVDIKEGDQLVEQRTGYKFQVLRVRQQGYGMGLAAAHLDVRMKRTKA